MKLRYPWILFLLFIPMWLSAQEKSDYEVHIGGFISSESVFDTRQTVSAREGDVLLYPAPVIYDDYGEDMNGNSTFNMFSIHSRLRAKVSGPEMFGAKTSALVETDFVGTSNEIMSMMRLRHAMIKLTWQKSELLLGQYWHPLFIGSAFPEVSTWGGGLPFDILSRSPQIRYTQHFTTHLTGSVTAITQRDFASTGPNGASAEYIRNAAVPEFDITLEYHTKTSEVGVIAGYKTIKPRLYDLDGNVTDLTLGSWQGSVYARKDWGKLTTKIKALYGQNLYNFAMIGGYVEYIDPVTQELSYDNYETLGTWAEFIYNQEHWFYGAFAGYTQNMGVSDFQQEGFEANRYARGTDIDYVYRVAPRVGYKINKFLIMAEVSYDQIAYGDTQDDGIVENTLLADNLRVQLHFRYCF